MKNSNIVILILAAGASSRMGSIKQLLPWKNTTLLGNAIETAKKVSTDVYVVLGASAEEIKSTVKEEVHFVINKDWENGLGSSIAYGVETIANNNKNYEGVLVMLADQPFINNNYLKELILLFKTKDKGIIATNYGSQVGVPVLFSVNYFNELQQLNKDFGAKNILKKYNEDVLKIQSKGKEKDIDTPEDYKNWLVKTGKKRR